MPQRLVLLVDDDEDNRVILQAILEHAGLAALAAADGTEALEKARKHRPALILMDLMMPGMDGWETTRLLKSHPATADIPVIAFTADDDPTTPQRLREGGFCAYLRKPYPPRQMLAAVRTCIEESSVGRRWIDLPAPDFGSPIRP